MVRYRYNQQIKPPAPFVHVALERPDGRAAIDNLPAQLDTAADLSVVPIGIVEKLGLVKFDAISIATFGGIHRVVATYLVRLNIRGHEPAVIEVLSNDEDPFILLGSDILNRHRILLDGPHAVLEID